MLKMFFNLTGSMNLSRYLIFYTYQQCGPLEEFTSNRADLTLNLTGSHSCIIFAARMSIAYIPQVGIYGIGGGKKSGSTRSKHSWGGQGEI
jgi:hypothetical protein